MNFFLILESVNFVSITTDTSCQKIVQTNKSLPLILSISYGWEFHLVFIQIFMQIVLFLPFSEHNTIRGREIITAWTDSVNNNETDDRKEKLACTCTCCQDVDFYSALSLFVEWVFMCRILTINAVREIATAIKKNKKCKKIAERQHSHSIHADPKPTENVRSHLHKVTLTHKLKYAWSEMYTDSDMLK